MSKFSYIISGLLVMLFFNCKSRHVVIGQPNYSLASKQLIKENAKQTPDFKTLQSKLKISYSQGENSQSHSVNFRIKKDEIIWLSATFSIVKAIITPEKFSFYNKLDKTYFEGDFSYLSKLLGTELDFEKAQNLLLGESLYNLDEGAYKSSVEDEVYVLQPKKQRDLFELFLLLDPSYYKVKSQQISQPKEYRHLEINYLSHQEVDKQILPEHIKVLAVEGNEEIIINLELKGVVLNEELRFPFKVPSGFKQVKL